MLPSHALATVTGPCTESIGASTSRPGMTLPAGAVPLQSGSRVPVDGTAPSRVTDHLHGAHRRRRGAGRHGHDRPGRPQLVGDGRPRVDLQGHGRSVRGDHRGADHRSGLQRGRVCVHRGAESVHHGRRRRRGGGRGGRRDPPGAVIHPGSGLGAARAPLQGFAGGATAGLGCVVLVQQFCIVPLTPASAAGIPVVVGAVGAIGASLARRAGARRARRDARLQAGFGRSGALGGPRGEPTEVIEHAGHVTTGAGYGAGGPSAIAGGGSGAEGGAGGGMGGPSGPSGGRWQPDPAPTAPIPPAPAPALRWGDRATDPAADGHRRGHVLELLGGELGPKPVLHELWEQARRVSSDPRMGTPIRDYTSTLGEPSCSRVSIHLAGRSAAW